MTPRQPTPRVGLRALVLLLLLSAALEAQRSAPGLEDRTNRFEGLVRLPISGGEAPAIDLLSFTGFFETFSAAIDLRVRFFVPDADARVRIIAQELTPELFYRMEAKPFAWPANAWSVFGPWPTRDVIIPAKVEPSNIGVVIYLAERPEGRAFVAPAFVEHGDGKAVLTRYRLQLRPVRATLSALDYALERLEGERHVPVTRARVAVERPEQRPFRLDLDAVGLIDGRYVLKVDGFVKNSSKVTVRREYEFEHRRLPS